MVQPQQIVDASTAVVVAPAPAPEPTATASVVVVTPDNDAAASTTAGPQIKPLLHTVATRARRSGLRMALGVIFVFGFASLVLTARSASFSRAWESSFSSVRSTSAGILRSTTRTVVPVLVHRDDDDQDQDQDAQVDSNATADNTNRFELRSIDTTSTPPTFALLRVIGNALPPRHDPPRTLQNLRFVLEHEQLDGSTDELTKHWVVNRILDDSLRTQIVTLLTEFGAAFTEIPFDLAAYATQPYRVVIEDEGVDSVHAATNSDSDTEANNDWLRVLKQNEIRDYKNRYALSVNAARNVMLAIGRRLGARWILPWDQNCFLRNDAWQRIKTDLLYLDRIASAADDSQPVKYVVVPMDRLVEENAAVLSPTYAPTPFEEPQLIFRSDARADFDERFRYGKRDKVALLVRLGVRGMWDNWGWSAWEQARTYNNVSLDVSNITVPSTGYVVRLFSGVPDLDDPSAAYLRELKRGEAVVNVLDSLETRVMRELVHYTREDLTVWNMSALAAMQRVYKTTGSKGTLKQLMQDAAKASGLIQIGGSAAWTVTRNAPVGAFNHTHVFSNFVDAPTPLDDAHVIADMAANTSALALAYAITGEVRFADKALAALVAWCIDDATAMEPLLDFADLSAAALAIAPNSSASYVGAASGVRVLATLPTLLDSMRLLLFPRRGSESSLPIVTVSNATRTGVLHWLERLFSYLRASDHAIHAFRAAPSVFGLQYDLVVAALASFLDDPLTLRYTLGTLQGRLVTMVDRASGQFVLPLGVAQAPYTMQSLATWGQALAAAQPLNLTAHLLAFDLSADGREETTTPDGGLLCRMVAANVPCCADSTADGLCVEQLQAAAPVHLFIYRRLVRLALPGCTQLAALPSCRSVAALALQLDDLSTRDLQRFSLAPYPFLLQV